MSFKHRGFLFHSKKPKLPTLFRIRSDMTWEQVLANWKEKKITTINGKILFYFIYFILVIYFVFLYLPVYYVIFIKLFYL